MQKASHMIEKQNPKDIQAKIQLERKTKNNPAFILNVDVKFPGKGITAVFGPSGSGKTTFLRCLAGLEKPEQGYVNVSDETWQNSHDFTPTHKRPLGYVFQEASLLSHLSVRQNLNYAINRCELSPSQSDFKNILLLLGLEVLLDKSADQLSGGERQRVAIASALLSQPKLLLMDEPLASLDHARKQEILPYLETLKAQLDLPIIYVSHSVDEVARLADHVIVIDNGKVVDQGEVSAVFHKLNLLDLNRQEAGVILRGRVLKRDEQWQLSCIDFSGGQLWVRDRGDALGQDVRVRVLPRDISLSLENHDNTSILNRIMATVLEVAEHSNKAMALVKLNVGNDVVVARVTKRSVSYLDIKAGRQIWAQIKSAAIVH